MLFGKRPLFGNFVEPACQYCRHARQNADGLTVLCALNGVVAPYYSCRRYQYDPLKRTPSRQPVLPEYDQTDFQL